MEAARVAKLRGHDLTLMERDKKLANEEKIGTKPQGWEYSEDAGEDDKKRTGSALGTSMITSEYQRLDHNE